MRAPWTVLLTEIIGVGHAGWTAPADTGRVASCSYPTFVRCQPDNSLLLHKHNGIKKPFNIVDSRETDCVNITTISNQLCI